MQIRQANPDDTLEWARMRNALWPAPQDDHLEEVKSHFDGRLKLAEVFVLERNQVHLGGFIELSVRDYAAGSYAAKVPYVEGWYVDPDLRGLGFGMRLMLAAEQWATRQGFRELASDVEGNNRDGIAVHKALGFDEVESIVCFIKRLP